MRRHARRPGTPRRDRHLHAVDEPPQGGAGDFLDAIAQTLVDPAPLGFLSLASTIVSTLDVRVADPAGPARRQGPDAATFLDSLIGHSTRETTALLLAMAALLPDNYLAQRARGEARRRDHPLPDWLPSLEDGEPGAALASTDVLGDGENAVVSMNLPGGHAITAVVYIDHNLGTVVKDAFLVPDGAEAFRDHFLAVATDPEGMEVSELDPAEARARIIQAIETGDATAHRLDTDTWPACRPVVEWMVGRLPAGGAGFRRPEWTERQRQAIVSQFMRSPEAAVLTGDEAGIVLDLLRFTTDYNGGDPLRWSWVNVEIVLADWYPRMVAGDERHLRRMPTVLRALVRYSHRQKEVPVRLTERTLDAVDIWEPVFVEAIVGRDDDDSPYDRLADLLGDELMGQWQFHQREFAVQAVGGEAALLVLDDAPLPDEGFRWNGIPDDVHERVAEVLRLCDGCAEEMFDVEMRTAFRRVLAQTAATDPAVFRRRSKESTAAAAIAWAVATVNDRLDPYMGGLTSKALLGHFGVTGSVSQRARPFLRAFGADEWQYSGNPTFGTPEVLVSERRAQLIRARDEVD